MSKWVNQENQDTKLIKVFRGDFSNVVPPPADATKIRSGLVLDTETTGLNHQSDTVIEIALRPFQFNVETFQIVSVGDPYSGLQDPGHALSKTTVSLTGLTDELLKGQSIDWKAVSSMMSETSLIIAHNARFDRPFVDQLAEPSESKFWGCSMSQVDWLSKGFKTQKLSLLTHYHGFTFDGHRALSDVDATLHLISMTDPESGKPYLAELTESIKRNRIRVFAWKSSYDKKDLLKNAGYKWNDQNKVWLKELFREEKEAETTWLATNIYAANCFNAEFNDIRRSDTFK
ncbi:MAG: 3'-5' exonuclease [Bdellovibrionia bacterium]